VVGWFYDLLTVQEWHALRLSFRWRSARPDRPPLAVAIGYHLARGQAKGRWLIEVLVNLPLVLPPVVVGYLLLVCFSPRGAVGWFLLNWLGVRVVFTWWGAVWPPWS